MSVSQRCFNCAEKGHLSKECPKPQSLMCYNCQENGHKTKSCPAGKYCHSCGDPTHLISVCPIRGPICYKCGIKGHLARECEDLPTPDVSKLLSILTPTPCCMSCGRCMHADLCCLPAKTF